MKKTLRKYFLLLFAVAFVCISALSYYSQTTQSQRTALLTIKAKINYLYHQIASHENNAISSDRRIKELLMNTAENLALILKIGPSLATDTTFLHFWKKKNDLEDLQITFPDDRFSFPFLNMLSTRLLQQTSFLFSQGYVFLTKSPCPSPNSKKLTAFTAWGADRRFIRISFSCQKYDDFSEKFSLEQLSQNFVPEKYGLGSILIAHNDKIIGEDGPDFDKKEVFDAAFPNGTENKKSGTMSFSMNGKKFFAYYENIKDYIFLGIYLEDYLYAKRNRLLLFNVCMFFILFFLTYHIMIHILNKTIFSGVQEINSSLDKITSGNLSERVSVQNNLEFASLSDSINLMVDRLQKAHQDSVTRTNNELQMAHKIQTSLQPNAFPAFPNENRIDLYAYSCPATEVSGDFYDFFFLDDNPSYLALVVADVAGKGMPAALYVIMLRTMLKNLAHIGYSPAELLTHINHRIYEENKNDIFITVFMGILNIENGKLTYVNAGHMPPYICRKNGKFKQIKAKPDFVLGAFDHTYREYELQLTHNDTLFIYTDGVTEAENKESAFFSQERLEEILNKSSAESPKSIVKNVHNAVKQFADTNEQSDDVTMLAIKYLKDTLTLPARLDKVDSVLKFMCDMTDDLSSLYIPDIEVAVAEIFTNIAKYAYTDRENEGFVDISCTIGGHPKFITITFSDSGIPFNPLDYPEPDVALPWTERTPGKMGIFMTKKLMDSVSYKYVGNRNVLTMVKQL